MEIHKIEEERLEKKSSLLSSLLKVAKSHKLLSFFVAVAAVFLLFFVVHGGLWSPTTAIKSMVFSVGKQVEIDDRGHTNFLLLGVGGGAHDGPDLTDTVIVASLDHDKEMVSMLSIPRDLYIKTDLTGGNRINSIYDLVKAQKGDSASALEYLKDELSEKLEMDIHYYAKIDFDGFRQVVDALGGIDVDVKDDIVDPYYPKEGTIEYETFTIRAGNQHLDGQTALKYVRSRKTTSDFDRSRRQQQVITALKDKALSLRTLTDPTKLTALYDSIASNYETNLTIREIINLGSIAENIRGSGKIVMNVIHDDPTRSGGILYVPIREFYNGMYVLLPIGDTFEGIAKYAEIVLYHPAVLAEGVSIQVLNGTRVVGRAARVRQSLQLLGFRVPRYGNASSLDVAESTIYIRNSDVSQETIDFISAYFSIKKALPIIPEYNELPYKSSSDLLIELGSDFKEKE